MRILWLSTSSMQLQPIIESLEYAMKVLFASVSSMNLEPIVSGLKTFHMDKHPDGFKFDATPYSNLTNFWLCKFDKGKEEQHHYEGEVDHVILEAFHKFEPTIVIYSGPAEGKCRPLLNTFHTMRKTAKVINLCCDGGCPNWHPLLETYRAEGCFDLTVNIDGNDQWPQSGRDLTLLGPIDPNYYLSKQLPKTVSLGFAGGNGSASRREAIAKLKESVGLVVPERSEEWGTYQKYADFMLGCRAVVNFSRTGSGKAYHVKYRVLEAGLANCCLFEENNPVTKKWFEPGMDYIPYDSIDELIEAFRLYQVTQRFVPANLHHKVVTNHSPEIFWGKVFSALSPSCHDLEKTFTK